MKDGIFSAAVTVGLLAILLTYGQWQRPEAAAETGEIITEFQEATEPETAPVTEPETEPETEPVTEPETEPATEPGPDCSEYPNACTVYQVLKQHGYSDAVIAGILGNMMAECGGQTLDLRWDAYGEDGCFYGVCQWNKWTYPEVQGQDLLFQINYLLETIESRFGDNYKKFRDSDNPRDAARRFSIWYEGCAKWSYPVRQSCAETAFEYITGGNGNEN